MLQSVVVETLYWLLYPVYTKNHTHRRNMQSQRLDLCDTSKKYHAGSGPLRGLLRCRKNISGIIFFFLCWESQTFYDHGFIFIGNRFLQLVKISNNFVCGLVYAAWIYLAGEGGQHLVLWFRDHWGRIGWAVVKLSYNWVCLQWHGIKDNSEES